MDNIEFSYFRFIWDINNPMVTTLEDFINSIRTPDAVVKHLIKKIRAATTKDEKDRYKKKLPCVTPAGLFTTKSDASISQMSGIVCIDLDHVKVIEAERKRLESYPIVLSIFLSPSGDGLKVLVKHDLKDPSHFNDLYKKLGADLGVDADSSCANISHACFISHDPNLYLNEQAETYHFEPPIVPSFDVPTVFGFNGKLEAQKETDDATVSRLTNPDEIEKAIIEEHEYFEQYNSFYEGNRNNKLFILAKFFLEAGIPEDDTTNYLVAYYANPKEGFPANEIIRTVHSAYTNN